MPYRQRPQMTTIVGIFDNARDLDKAVERLARAGFEDTVYDEAVVAEEPSNACLVVFAPGYAPAMVWGSAEPTLKPKLDRHAIVQTFKAHLADYHLPNEVIEAYATMLFTMASSSWSGQTTSTPTKSLRSCESAALLA